MTRKTFYKKLEKTSYFTTKFNWKLTKKGEIRATKGKSKKCYCPITAVCENETGEYYGINNAHLAVAVLDLDSFDEDYIMSASDNENNEVVTVKRVRDSILRKVGLKE